MTRKKSTLSVLVLTAALLLGGNAVANASDGTQPSPHKDCAMSALSQEQIEAFKALHDTLAETSLPLRQQKIVKKAELKAEMMSPTPNTEKVLRLHRELGDLKGKLAIARIKFRTDCMDKGLPPLPKWPECNSPKHHVLKKGRDCK